MRRVRRERLHDSVVVRSLILFGRANARLATV